MVEEGLSGDQTLSSAFYNLSAFTSTFLVFFVLNRRGYSQYGQRLQILRTLNTQLLFYRLSSPCVQKREKEMWPLNECVFYVQIQAAKAGLYWQFIG